MECSVRKLRQMALPDPQDEREVWCAKELKWAADTIESLAAERDELKKELGRANAFHERLAGRLDIRQDADGSTHDEIDRLNFENAALKAEVEPLRQWYADSHRIIDEWDTKCSALRAELNRYRWVPVSERLPTDYKSVLTWDGSWQDTDSLDSEAAEGVWLQREGTTHWMPLPEPPEQQ